MMYYTPVSGWMLSYFFKFATGTFESGMTAEQVGNVFSNLMSNPVEMIIWMAVMAIAGFFVCSKGIQNGIEKSQQGYDDFIACADYYSCDKQSYFIGCCRGHKVLPCA